jgi:hypothetical protein
MGLTRQQDMNLVNEPTRHAIQHLRGAYSRYSSYCSDEWSYLDQSSDIGKSWENLDTPDGSRSIKRGQLLELGTKPTIDATFFSQVMAWGFGPAGYAQFRNRRMLEQFGEQRSSPEEWLLQLRAAAADGPLSGFQFLQDNHIAYLGPSFATKHLYSRSPKSNQSSIIDSVVVAWLWRFGVASDTTPIQIQNFDLASYHTYVEFVDQAVDELTALSVANCMSLDRGLVEYLMFQDESRFRAMATLDTWNQY